MKPSAVPRRTPGQAGFSLLEAVVALALVTVALGLSAALLVDAGRQSRRLAAGLEEPLMGRLAARLRKDSAEAVRILPSPAPPDASGWYSTVESMQKLQV